MNQPTALEEIQHLQTAACTVAIWKEMTLWESKHSAEERNAIKKRTRHTNGRDLDVAESIRNGRERNSLYWVIP